MSRPRNRNIVRNLVRARSIFIQFQYKSMLSYSFYAGTDIIKIGDQKRGATGLKGNGPSNRFEGTFPPRSLRAFSIRGHFSLQVRGHFRLEGTFPPIKSTVLSVRGHFYRKKDDFLRFSPFIGRL